MSFTVRGMASLEGEVSIRLIQIEDPLDWEEALSDLWRGKNEAFEALISDNIVAENSNTFNAQGDITDSFTIDHAGDYLILVLKEDDSETTFYAATLVEVLEGELTATPSDDYLNRGTQLDVQLSYSGNPTGSHVFGAALIKESAYKAIALLTSQGTVPTTSLKVNGATLIEGEGEGFSVFGGGLSGLSQQAITDFLSEALKSYEYSVAFSTSTSSTSTTLSIDTDGLREDDYVLLAAVWDSDSDLSSGGRILGIDQDTVYINVPAPAPPPPPPPAPTPPTPEEFLEESLEDQVETLEGLDPEDAADLLEEVADDVAAQVLSEMDPEDAAEILENIDPENASDILEEAGVEEASDIVENMNASTAVEVITQLNTSTAAQIVEEVSEEAAAEIVEAAVSANTTDAISQVLLLAEEETVGEVLLEADPDAGAHVVRAMAEQNLTGAARRVEAAVEIQIESLDPEKKTAYRQRIREIIESPALTVEDLVDLFVEIANLPDTPSTVAEILEIISLEKAVEVVTSMVEEGYLTETSNVLGFLSVEKLQELYAALSATARAMLYPHLSLETVANLPQLGEFTVDLSISKDKVEPGETVTITALISNIGEESDSVTISLSIDGEVEDTQIVTLDAGGSTTLTWDVAETAVGTYTVEVLGETIAFTVEAPPTPPLPASIQVKDLQVSPATPVQGATVTITFTVENTGELEGEYSVEVKVDGSPVETLEGSLEGGDAETLTVEAVAEEEGAHTVSVDGLSAQFTVSKPPRPFPVTTAVVVVVVVLAVAVYLYMRRQQ